VQQPEAFRQFARHTHQDIHLEVSNLDELARFMLAGLDAGQRPGLRRYLDHLLATLTPAEMKGVLNRASTDLRFDTKAAAELLRRAAERLAAEEG
jgi:hypothetical protein